MALPTVALAYEAPGIDTIVTDATPMVGEETRVTITGAEPSSEVTLTVTSNPASLPVDAIEVAGTRSFSKAADPSGTVDFRVTFTESAVYNAAATDAAGSLLGDLVLTVSTVDGEVPSVDDGGLALSGAEVAGVVAGATVVCTIGVGVVVLVRRRSATQKQAGR
ncbi:peptidase [Sanguibacter sp. YZGR15]|uniref:Peptidase n=1 Tax=Sanguibacter suaedae TaxID=2795737 RepID=A0A934I6H4_9MICO|nr:peptidase [Sanguibacter suaedae]